MCIEYDSDSSENNDIHDGLQENDNEDDDEKVDE